jgi:hypothetical protein
VDDELAGETNKQPEAEQDQKGYKERFHRRAVDALVNRVSRLFRRHFRHHISMVFPECSALVNNVATGAV